MLSVRNIAFYTTRHRNVTIARIMIWYADVYRIIQMLYGFPFISSTHDELICLRLIDPSCRYNQAAIVSL